MTGPASKRIIVAYGFWIFLLSDIVMFSCFFAAFAVQRDATAGGPGIRDLVEMPRVALETGALLLSSYTCGLSFAATNARSKLWTQVFLVITGLLGLAFQSREGLVTLSAATLALLFLPALAFGVWLGARSFRAADPHVFRRVVLALLAVLAALTAVQAALNLP